MTRDDIMHLAQVLVSIRPLISDGKLSEDEADQLIHRMLWAIHASHDNPRFDEQKFHAFVRGKLDADAHAIFM